MFGIHVDFRFEHLLGGVTFDFTPFSEDVLQSRLRLRFCSVCVRGSGPAARPVTLPKLIFLKASAFGVKNLARRCLLHHCMLTSSSSVSCIVSADEPKV